MLSVVCFQNISPVLLFLCVCVFFSFWVDEYCDLVLRFFTVLFLVCFSFDRELKTVEDNEPTVCFPYCCCVASNVSGW